MAFTQSEAKVLGALSVLGDSQDMTVRQISRATGLPDTSIHRALLRLSRSGLAVGTPRGTARWRSTERGRLAIARSVYREYTA
ncbi:helix-turn-helix domain-containing protein [Nocardia tengchongensis]|uniref:helix-turn-helix domain-containing protein n=1 Tax=Nocardia tengchongensis TaxID=2055889 RepID=UPI00368EEC0E